MSRAEIFNRRVRLPDSISNGLKVVHGRESAIGNYRRQYLRLDRLLQLRRWLTRRVLEVARCKIAQRFVVVGLGLEAHCVARGR